MKPGCIGIHCFDINNGAHTNGGFTQGSRGEQFDDSTNFPIPGDAVNLTWISCWQCSWIGLEFYPVSVQNYQTQIQQFDSCTLAKLNRRKLCV